VGEDGSAYSASVIVEEFDPTQTPDAQVSQAYIDRELVVCAEDTPPPAFTSTCDDTVIVNLGESLSITAFDPRLRTPGNRVQIVPLGELPFDFQMSPSGTTHDACNAGCNGTNVLTVGPNTLPGYYTMAFGAASLCSAKPGPDVTCTKTIYANALPNCSGATASIPAGPNNGSFQVVTISGVVDPDGGPVTITVTDIKQDEPIGTNCPDAVLGVAKVRRETVEPEGDGRVYTITFTATDDEGQSTECTATVCVPKTGESSCVNQGAVYNSLNNDPDCSDGSAPEGSSGAARPTELSLRLAGMKPNLTTIEYSLPSDADVQVSVYDIAGRNLKTLENSRRPAGIHRIDWNTAGLAKGVYYYRLNANGRVVSKSILHLR
jgi:hypothetical protein